jgi:hypothetical protein
MAKFLWIMTCRRRFCSFPKANSFPANEYAGFRYPPFMKRSSGHILQQRIWQETKDVFEKAVPEAATVYSLLDRKGDVVESKT